MTEKNKIGQPLPETQSSGDGAGRPPRKTALGYAGADDPDEESKARAQMRNQRAAELAAKRQAFRAEKARSREVRVSAPDPDNGKKFIDQTKAGLDFPQPEPTRNYSFNFAALSSNSLTFDDHARVVVERIPILFVCFWLPSPWRSASGIRSKNQQSYPC